MLVAAGDVHSARTDQWGGIHVAAGGEAPERFAGGEIQRVYVAIPCADDDDCPGDRG